MTSPTLDYQRSTYRSMPTSPVMVTESSTNHPDGIKGKYSPRPSSPFPFTRFDLWSPSPLNESCSIQEEEEQITDSQATTATMNSYLPEATITTRSFINPTLLDHIQKAYRRGVPLPEALIHQFI